MQRFKIAVILSVILCSLTVNSHAGLWSKPNPPEPGTSVEALPRKYEALTVNGIVYYYSRGSYYSRVGDHYMVNLPPVGAVVKRIPGYYKKAPVYSGDFYTYHNIYYLRITEGYRVVAKPLGAK